ncbi:BamA/TamA family outer membrane protein [Aurantibacillus circumpalustris]|uniref:BamA/TamA family outer membrane protein n=1 Tax=Aurantibacillus circumpalustris TaxID=3036359 RepID=UPI00295B0142|nr:BamA/TamA family outer membrane protein [Aurantibacillus circumpalustris]
MPINLKRIGVFFILVASQSALYSAVDDSTKFKPGALPTAFYTPETRLGVGALAFTFFKTKPQNKKSNTQSYLSYTWNKQFFFENDYQLWMKANDLYFTGTFGISRFPEFFYGIGNRTHEKDRFMISFDLIKIQTKNLKRISENFYGGIYYQYEKLYNQDITLKNKMMSEIIPGGMGYISSGLGPILIFDKRNNPLNPSKGAYIETSYLYFDKYFGSENKFSSFVFDARKYEPLFHRLVWNANVYLALAEGAVPYRMLATLGGPRFLRGYYNGRFRDKNMMLLQQEFRMPIYKRLGLAAFGGIGSVSHIANELFSNQIHYDYGIGLRIEINKKEHANLRIDYGITRDSHGLYIVFAEAF